MRQMFVCPANSMARLFSGVSYVVIALALVVHAGAQDNGGDRGEATDPARMRPSVGEDVKKLITEPREAVLQLVGTLSDATKELRGLSESYRRDRSPENRRRVLGRLVTIMVSLKCEADGICGASPGQVGGVEKVFQDRLKRLEDRLARENTAEARKRLVMKEEIHRLEKELSAKREATARLVAKHKSKNDRSGRTLTNAGRHALFLRYMAEQRVSDALLGLKGHLAQSSDAALLASLKDEALSSAEITTYQVFRRVRRLSLQLEVAADRVESIIRWQSYADLVGSLEGMADTAASFEDRGGRISDELSGLLDMLRPDQTGARIKMGSFSSDFDTWLAEKMGSAEGGDAQKTVRAQPAAKEGDR